MISESLGYSGHFRGVKVALLVSTLLGDNNRRRDSLGHDLKFAWYCWKMKIAGTGYLTTILAALEDRLPLDGER